MYRDGIKLMSLIKIFNIRDQAYLVQNNNLSIEELRIGDSKKKYL